ncbi:uncharacterized protein RCC_11534 [Ramularia collo-cygni]|uniref:Uncharacterized protein n=1 Tax=Ramularia collo-cygni TaxID=112498 RepID=A0A2D3VF37_9PEZI|nr:uncharacterized protein RCC_11534 [Ramularia collo-cygni]CZT25865.1 uncharacterized protein RCC_11534 [Ramularia collo-cygni]
MLGGAGSHHEMFVGEITTEQHHHQTCRPIRTASECLITMVRMVTGSAWQSRARPGTRRPTTGWSHYVPRWQEWRLGCERSESRSHRGRARRKRSGCTMCWSTKGLVNVRPLVAMRHQLAVSVVTMSHQHTTRRGTTRWVMPLRLGMHRSGQMARQLRVMPLRLGVYRSGQMARR